MLGFGEYLSVCISEKLASKNPCFENDNAGTLLVDSKLDYYPSRASNTVSETGQAC
jgi:hypothetical protein